MSQILDLSKTYSKEQVEEKAAEASQYDDIPAGGYVCSIVDAILVNKPEEKKNYIELHLDIAEGPYKGYFQRLEDRAGFWGLTHYASFKDTQIGRFDKFCKTFELNNPGFSFNPFNGGGADVDTLKGKLIGVVTRKEEYENKNGEIREKNTVANTTEIKKIKDGNFTVPKTKKLEKAAGPVDDSFLVVSSDTQGTCPF